jgi:thiol-disulfide isomerase/thioredoxin
MIRKNRIHLTTFMVLAILLAFGDSKSVADSRPAEGGPLPPIELHIPGEPRAKGYLGLSGEGSFQIPEIKATVVIIEIFSLYCPACVKIAPGIKAVYEEIEMDPNLKGKIKLIGIGAGNTPQEVQEFGDITRTPFPLFPDEDFTIHEALGGVRTPYLIAIRIHGDGTHEVIHSELAGFECAQTFLERIKTSSDIDMGEVAH